MKKITMFLLVSLVVCSSVFAFTGMGNILSGSSKDSEVVEVPAPSAEVAEPSLSAEPSKTSNPVSTALSDLNEKKSLNRKDLAAHRANLEAVASDVEMLVADMEAIHPFAVSGLKIGFKNGYPVFGGVLGGGVKFGTSGIMAQGNLSYDVVTLRKGFKWNKFSVDNMALNLMVGYEF